jgi:hypothetical protein
VWDSSGAVQEEINTNDLPLFLGEAPAIDLPSSCQATHAHTTYNTTWKEDGNDQRQGCFTPESESPRRGSFTIIKLGQRA